MWQEEAEARAAQADSATETARLQQQLAAMRVQLTAAEACREERDALKAEVARLRREKADLEEEVAFLSAELDEAGGGDGYSPEEVAKHQLTHVPYAPWRQDCIAGRGRENSHRRGPAEERTPNVIAVDYCYFDSTVDGEDQKERAGAVLVGVDVDTGNGFGAPGDSLSS